MQNKGNILHSAVKHVFQPVPQSYAGFPASLGWNVLCRGRVWQNVIYVANSEVRCLKYGINGTICSKGQMDLAPTGYE